MATNKLVALNRENKLILIREQKTIIDIDITLSTEKITTEINNWEALIFESVSHYQYKYFEVDITETVK